MVYSKLFGVFSTCKHFNKVHFGTHYVWRLKNRRWTQSVPAFQWANMLSKAIFQCISLICSVGYRLGSFPWEWDPVSSQIKVTTSTFKIIQWKILTLYTYINTIFMIIRIVQAATILNTPATMVVLNMFNVVTWITASAFQTNTILHTENVAEFINQFMKNYDHFKSILQIISGFSKITASF